MTAHTVHAIQRCANPGCPNLPHEGEFAILVGARLVDGSGIPVVLVMCMPCANAFDDVRPWERQILDGAA
jgi:hypothetical protein